MKNQQSITTLPPSPDEERKGRMVRYGIAMGVRTVCIIIAFFVHGWWLLVLVIAAVVLPYIAVVVANQQMNPRGGAVERPGAIVLAPKRTDAP